MKKEQAIKALEQAIKGAPDGSMATVSVEVLRAVFEDNAKQRDFIQILNDENVVLNDAMESVIHALRHFIPNYPMDGLDD